MKLSVWFNQLFRQRYYQSIIFLFLISSVLLHAEDIPTSFQDGFTPLQVHKDLDHLAPLKRSPTKQTVDAKLLNWIESNRSEKTKLPFSFFISQAKRGEEYAKMGKSDSVPGIIERTIVAEGFSVYDVAVWQIMMTMLGDPEHLEDASRPIKFYWEGHIGSLRNIRAGYPIHPFIYDPTNLEAVSSDMSEKGKRGFVFRLLNANGAYNTADPLDGKTEFPDFPNWPTVHWEDWKPIAGENAWIVTAALQLYHKKYYDSRTKTYRIDESSTELLLAQEIARAALMLQADNGGIRMAPLGTYFHLLNFKPTESLEDIDRELDIHARRNKSKANELGGYPSVDKIYKDKNLIWYYQEISTENNISWYAAFKMLYTVTQKPIYQEAMNNIEKYLKSVWNAEEHYFYQGAHFVEDPAEPGQNDPLHLKGHWVSNKEIFATDCQTWAITKIGAERLDDLFGEGAAYHMWQKTKAIAGVHNAQGDLTGVDFTKERNRVSIEWTAGAVFAARKLSSYYQNAHPDWAQEAKQDAQTMRKGIEEFRTELSEDQAAYSYSSVRGWIPFGWFSHNRDVLSLASTCWVILLDAGFYPTYFPE